MKTQNSKLKTQNHNSKVKTFTLCALVLHFAFCTLSSKKVYAASVTTQATVGTPSVTPITKKTLSPTPTTVSPSATPTDEKVQEIREAVEEKVKEKIQEIKDKIEKKGYVGILSEMTDSTLTLQTLTGEKMVSLDSQAKIIGVNKKEIKSKDLEIDQKLICMGNLDENNIMIAKRVIVVSQPTKAPPTRKAFIGRIAEIDNKKNILTLNHLRKLNQKYLVKIDNKTKFLSGSLKELKLDEILLVISSSEKENETSAALLINPF